MKNCKLCSALLISLLIICPAHVVNSCAWDDWDIDEEYLKPFEQELPDFSGYTPFLYSEHYWYQSWGENTSDSREENLADWAKYYRNVFSTQEIGSVLYDADYEKTRKLADYISGQSGPAEDYWKMNPLVNHWKENKNDPTFRYILFAKSVEPTVTGWGWWDTPDRDTMLMTQLKVDAIKELTRAKDPFLKLRYTYQAMRLAHYTGSYQECINLYDKYIQGKETGSVIEYWCLSLKAGAYWRQGKFAESSYYNSIVFDKCPSRRLYAERDFWIDSEATWQRCLAMCKNDHEKNILWLLTGINQNNSALPALYEMLKIDPSSMEVELLFAREMEKMQRNHMPLAWYSDVEGEDDYSYAPEANDIEEILALIKTALDTKKLRTPSYWYSAAAFIYFVNGDYGHCDQNCEIAIETANGNEKLIKQARIIRILNSIEEYGKINPEIEQALLPELTWLKQQEEESAKDTYKLALFRLMEYYERNDDQLDAEMCRAQVVAYYDIYLDPEMETVEELYSFFTDKTKRPFQNFLAGQYPYDADAMLEIKGTLLMREYKWEEAIAAFSARQGTESGWMELRTDPFLIHIWDCHDCDFMESPDDYTKLSFAKEMLQMEQKLKTNVAEEERAKLCHRLGNGYYNITHYGNSWMAIDYYLSTGYWEYNQVDPEDTEEFVDCSKAAYYYQQAFNLSADKEFKAMNLFMLAKCEQNTYYESEEYDYGNIDGEKEKYRTNFALLHQRYRNTEFYRQAIDECKYFHYYVNTH